MVKKKSNVPSDRWPIWLSDWVLEYSGGKGRSVKKYVHNVIVKGPNENHILANEQYLRRALFLLDDIKKSRSQVNDVISKYKPISINLVKQIGFGIQE